MPSDLKKTEIGKSILPIGNQNLPYICRGRRMGTINKKQILQKEIELEKEHIFLLMRRINIMRKEINIIQNERQKKRSDSKKKEAKSF